MNINDKLVTEPKTTLVPEILDLREVYNKGKEIDKGVSTNILNRELDIELHPGIITICGMTGHGKSMLCNSIAYNVITKGYNVLYISLEISKPDIYYQMMSIHTFDNYNENQCVSHSDIKYHKITSEQENIVFDKAWKEFKNLPGNLFVLEECDYNPTNPHCVFSAIQEVEKYSIAKTSKGIDVIIIDYIQLFKNYTTENTRSSNETEALSSWINFYRKLSVKYLNYEKGIPIIVVSQLNRDAYKEVTKHNIRRDNLKSSSIRLDMSQIAGSIEIIKASTEVIAIFTDDSGKASNECKIFKLKNRNGTSYEDGIPCPMYPKYYTVGHGTKKKNESYDGDLFDILNNNFPMI